jgi:hypothetical protein
MADERVVIEDGIVERGWKPWTPTVRRYLLHLRQSGATGLPRPLIAPEGRDAVSYIGGDSLDGYVYDEEQSVALGKLLRQIHDAGTRCQVREGDTWQPFEFRVDGAPQQGAVIGLGDIVIGHGDTGPWNVIARSDTGVPTFIDWEFAGPIVRRDELSATAWLNFRFHDPLIEPIAAQTSLESKVVLLAKFLSGYGLPRELWPDLVDGMIQYAIRDAAYEATRLGVLPDSAVARPSTAWRLAWRCRSASWIEKHREQLRSSLHEHVW